MSYKRICFECSNRKNLVTGSLLCVGCFKEFADKMRARVRK